MVLLSPGGYTASPVSTLPEGTSISNARSLLATLLRFSTLSKASSSIFSNPMKTLLRPAFRHWAITSGCRTMLSLRAWKRNSLRTLWCRTNSAIREALWMSVRKLSSVKRTRGPGVACNSAMTRSGLFARNRRR